MSDRAEQAFRDAFEEQADVPLGTVGPPRRHRRPIQWLAAAAVVLVGLGVPLWLLLDGNGDIALPADTTSPPVVEETEPTLSGLPAPQDGWKWVSRYDVAVQVPEAWAYSGYAWASSAWCIDAKSEPDVPEAPFVSSPQGVVAAIDCGEFRPEWVQMHLDWLRSGAEPGAPLTEQVSSAVGDTEVVVTLTSDPSDEDRVLAEEITGSAVTFERDLAGCTPGSPITDIDARPSPAWEVAQAEAVLEIGLCRYEERAGGSLLVGSRLLVGEHASAFAAAAAAAPEGTGGDPDTCIEGYGATSGVVVHVLDASGVHDLFLRVDGCRLLGSDDGTTRRLLTEDMCIPIFREETPNMVTGQGVDPTLCWR
ncbi:hypothetical protein GCM10028820_21880 [Tessaracoccus terricola]